VPARSAAGNLRSTKAIAYMRERKAFGRRIADFQALQFRVADIATSLETARSILWRAASALDQRSPEATRLCAQAKQVATDAGFAAANDALQLFGGTAISPTIASRSWFATSACTRSSRARTRSCG
jgi:alkylation response protein AidB-like acyl-CoA dehydrogenase